MRLIENTKYWDGCPKIKKYSDLYIDDLCKWVEVKFSKFYKQKGIKYWTWNHISLLINEGFVLGKNKEKWRSEYIITKKGMIAIERIKEIMNTEAKEPKIRMEF